MLATRERWGGGRDERPYLPRAFSYARARGGRTLELPARSRRSRTQRLAELAGGGGRWLWSAHWASASNRDAGTPAAAGRRRHRGRTAAVPARRARPRRRSCSASARPPTPRRRALFAADARACHRRRLGWAARPRHGAAARGARRRRAQRPCSPAGRRRCSRRSGAMCAERERPRRSSRSSRGWRAASAPASAAWCPTEDGYIRLCVDGPVLDAEELETALVAGGGH